ncbi:MAG: adenine phosphoribosyltransferase [Candidatus Acididesulfobacter guangdongensis]|uniref:Adenine phosphoribosyltransferase n=1 Tax=Acididesulfobacter guangdongensis TaxID=2597225 RepID=A0A519BHH9_ACIG2|nr:MAG: adenine phosphoribosyltransferase [Candidatus Acididesulfobacter guangdongensis]
MKNIKNPEELKSYIREVPDFPKKGINFYDITTLLTHSKAFNYTIDMLANRYIGESVDYIVSVEARGFVFGSALAYKLGCGVILVRKPGKLPAECNAMSYDLEYGSATLEIHKDALKENDRVVIADDVLATGGTAAAVAGLISEFKAEVVEAAFLAELAFLNGREKLKPYRVFSLISY